MNEKKIIMLEEKPQKISEPKTVQVGGRTYKEKQITIEVMMSKGEE